MLDSQNPDLDAMLGGLMSPEATAPPATPAQATPLVTVAQAHAVAQPSARPIPTRQAAVVVDAATQFSQLYGIAEHDSPREYAAALGKALAGLLAGGTVEDALTVGGAMIFERIQSVHGVTEAEAFDYTRESLATACMALVDDILSRRVTNKYALAQNQYRENLVLTAIREIQLKEGRGVTVARILNRIGRTRWSGDAVQSIINLLLAADKIYAVASAPGPGRKAIRYAIKED